MRRSSGCALQRRSGAPREGADRANPAMRRVSRSTWQHSQRELERFAAHTMGRTVDRRARRADALGIEKKIIGPAKKSYLTRKESWGEPRGRVSCVQLDAAPEARSRARCSRAKRQPASRWTNSHRRRQVVLHTRRRADSGPSLGESHAPVLLWGPARPRGPSNTACGVRSQNQRDR